MGAAAPRILIGTPTYNGQLTVQYTHSLLGLWQAIGSVCAWETTKATLVGWARNLLASRTLQDGYTHLLFIDADIEFPADLIEKMLAFDQPVTAAIYPQRAFDVAAFHEQARQHADTASALAATLSFPVELVTPRVSRGDFYQARTAPTGLMLIKREVLEAMRDAYPDLYRPAAGSYYGHHRLVSVLQCFEALYDESGVAMSEDIAFCRRWSELGGEIWAVFDPRVGHIGPFTFRPLP
jgi:hypothetical protein